MYVQIDASEARKHEGKQARLTTMGPNGAITTRAGKIEVTPSVALLRLHKDLAMELTPANLKDKKLELWADSTQDAPEEEASTQVGATPSLPAGNDTGSQDGEDDSVPGDEENTEAPTEKVNQ